MSIKDIFKKETKALLNADLGMVSILIIIALISLRAYGIHNIYLSVLLAGISIILAIISVVSYRKYKKTANKNDNSTEMYYLELQERIEKNKAKQEDIQTLMISQIAEIKSYYIISKKQAENSFRLAVAMCIVGIILISIAIVLPIIMLANIYVAIIPAVGGALVEVIAGTSLVVYRNSLDQLKHYFMFLHETERFLSSVNLIQQLNPENRDEVLKDIIHIEMSRDISIK